MSNCSKRETYSDAMLRRIRLSLNTTTLQIYSSVDSAEKSLDSLSKGNLEDAFRKAEAAFLASEKAFFDPSLLALLYFPDDQKYAIYIPLFLPVSIPVLLSLRYVLTDYFSRKTSKSKKQD